jgi:exopolysaccharide biosynthesis polyprenyl glycosylphosphotransferase
VAISSALRDLERVEWRTTIRPPRPPLAAVIPGFDAAALAGATILVDHADLLGIAYIAVTFCVLMAAGTQRTRINPRLSDDLASLVGWLSLPVLLVAPLTRSDAALGHFVRIVPAAMALVVAGRVVAYTAIRETRARGLIHEPTLIVGAGKLGVKAAQTLLDHPEFGLVPVGFLDSFEDDGLPVPILGEVHALTSIVREFGVRRVIVAFGATREPEMVPIIRTCDRLPVEVHVMPRFFELGVSKEGAFSDDLWGIPLIRLRRSALRTAAWRTKRAFDLVVASAALIILSPVLGLAALAVRLSSPGPVFFRQKRIGQRGEVFECLKFRTLPVNNDSDTRWTVDDPGQRTRLGTLLRRTGIDEIPQLLNVVRGEMSLVGPRPERPFFVDQFRVAVPGYDDRHRVPQGMTGWAQVHGLRGDTSIEERAVFDNHYVENWSLWRDIVILFRTIGTVLRGAGY